jgi:hypothetical protein
MAFFTKKGAERRKANRERRQNNRENRREHRQKMREIRQENQTERTRLRTSSKTDQAQIQAESDKIAYENGVQPIERETIGGKIIDKVGGIVGGFFGSNNQDSNLDFALSDFPGSEPPQQKRSFLPIILVGLAAFFLLPKLFKK